MRRFPLLCLLVSAVCFAVGPDVFHHTAGSSAAEYWLGGTGTDITLGSAHPNGYGIPGFSSVGSTTQTLTLTALDCVTSNATTGGTSTVFTMTDATTASTCSFTIPCSLTNATVPAQLRVAAVVGSGNGCTFKTGGNDHFYWVTSSTCTGIFGAMCSLRGTWQ